MSKLAYETEKDYLGYLAEELQFHLGQEREMRTQYKKHVDDHHELGQCDICQLFEETIEASAEQAQHAKKLIDNFARGLE